MPNSVTLVINRYGNPDSCPRKHLSLCCQLTLFQPEALGTSGERRGEGTGKDARAAAGATRAQPPLPAGPGHVHPPAAAPRGAASRLGSRRLSPPTASKGASSGSSNGSMEEKPRQATQTRVCLTPAPRPQPAPLAASASRPSSDTDATGQKWPCEPPLKSISIYFFFFLLFKVTILALFGLCPPAFQGAKRLPDLPRAAVVSGPSCRAEMSNALEQAGACG